MCNLYIKKAPIAYDYGAYDYNAYAQPLPISQGYIDPLVQPYAQAPMFPAQPSVETYYDPKAY